MQEKSKKFRTLLFIQTQHSVDWKVSIGGAEGAEDWADAKAAGGGADGIFSWGGALGFAPDAPFVWPYFEDSCSCIAANCSTATKTFCLKYKLCMPIWNTKKISFRKWIEVQINLVEFFFILFNESSHVELKSTYLRKFFIIHVRELFKCHVSSSEYWNIIFCAHFCQ